MKRELTAVALLFLLLAVSLVNLKYYDGLTDEIKSSLEAARQAAEVGDSSAAEEAFLTAESRWLRAGLFTSTLLRHPEVDSISDAFFELKGLLAEGGREACGAAFDKLLYHLDCIDAMEHARLGSIF